MAHGLDQIARHASELEQTLGAALRQRRDDLVHVAAGAEVSARAAQDDGAHRTARGRVAVRGMGVRGMGVRGMGVRGMGVRGMGIAQRAEQVAQLRVGIKRERVLALGAIQSDDAHAPFLVPQEVIRSRCERVHVLMCRLSSPSSSTS
jgi:hypothetical protein